jgi:hypothetical protein
MTALRNPPWIQTRVAMARQRQRVEFLQRVLTCNARIGTAINQMQLRARAYQRVLKLARDR